MTTSTQTKYDLPLHETNIFYCCQPTDLCRSNQYRQTWHEPRCPCVLLLDVSGSMAEIVGESGQRLGYTVQQDGKTYDAVSGGVTRIALLNQGLKTYQSELVNDPLAAQRVARPA